MLNKDSLSFIIAVWWFLISIDVMTVEGDLWYFSFLLCTDVLHAMWKCWNMSHFGMVAAFGQSSAAHKDIYIKRTLAVWSNAWISSEYATGSHGLNTHTHTSTTISSDDCLCKAAESIQSFVTSHQLPSHQPFDHSSPTTDCSAIISRDRFVSQRGLSKSLSLFKLNDLVIINCSTKC